MFNNVIMRMVVALLYMQTAIFVPSTLILGNTLNTEIMFRNAIAVKLVFSSKAAYASAMEIFP